MELCISDTFLYVGLKQLVKTELFNQGSFILIPNSGSLNKYLPCSFSLSIIQYWFFKCLNSKGKNYNNSSDMQNLYYWNNYQNNLKFHESILPNVREIYGQQNGCIFLNKKKQNTKNKHIPYLFFLILLQWKALPAYKGKNKDINLTFKNSVFCGLLYINSFLTKRHTHNTLV